MRYKKNGSIIFRVDGNFPPRPTSIILKAPKPKTKG